MALKLASKLSTGSFGSPTDIYAYHRPFRPIPKPADYEEPRDRYPPMESLIRKLVTVNRQAGAIQEEVDGAMARQLDSLRV